MKTKFLVLLGLALLIFVSGCTQPPQGGPSVCTTDVMQCPDGSYVSRDPNNNCQFYQCSSPQTGLEVKTLKNNYTVGEDMQIEFSNKGTQTVIYSDPFSTFCSNKYDAFKVYKKIGGVFVEVGGFIAPECYAPLEQVTLAPGEKKVSTWSIPEAYLEGEALPIEGTYKLEFTYTQECPPDKACVAREDSLKTQTNEFEIVQSEEEEIQANLDEEFELRVSETAFIENEGLKIKFLDVTEDSRCPDENIACIWEGQASILVNVNKEGIDFGNVTLTLRASDTNFSTEVIDAYLIRLVKVEPYPSTLETIPDANYVATLVVSKPETVWVASEPLQCRTNDWEVWGDDSVDKNADICQGKPDGTAVASGTCNSCTCQNGEAVCTLIACEAPTEEQLLKLYYQGVHGVSIFGYMNIPEEPGTGTCTACECPRGDTIKVRVLQTDMQKMLGLEWKTEESLCVERGGEWKAHCGLIGDCCNYKTSDFGKACTDGDQCEGDCISNFDDTNATAGTCSEWKTTFGCFNIIEDGSFSAICVD